MLLQHLLSNRNRGSLYCHETLYFDLTNERFLNSYIGPGPLDDILDQGVRKCLSATRSQHRELWSQTKAPGAPGLEPGKSTKFMEANRFYVNLDLCHQPRSLSDSRNLVCLWVQGGGKTRTLLDSRVRGWGGAKVNLH